MLNQAPQRGGRGGGGGGGGGGGRGGGGGGRGRGQQAASGQFQVTGEVKKLEGEFDFATAAQAFEKLSVSAPPPPTAPSAAASGDEGGSTSAAAPPSYDKKKSFFDNISCESSTPEVPYNR